MCGNVKWYSRMYQVMHESTSEIEGIATNVFVVYSAHSHSTATYYKVLC